MSQVTHTGARVPAEPWKSSVPLPVYFQVHGSREDEQGDSLSSQLQPELQGLRSLNGEEEVGRTLSAAARRRQYRQWGHCKERGMRASVGEAPH